METITDPQELTFSMEEIISESTLKGEFFGLQGTFPYEIRDDEDIPETVKDLARTIEKIVAETYKDEKLKSVELILQDLEKHKSYARYQTFIVAGEGYGIPAIVFLESGKSQEMPLTVVAQVRLRGDYEQKGISLLRKLNELGATMDPTSADYHLAGAIIANGLQAIRRAKLEELYK